MSTGGGCLSLEGLAQVRFLISFSYTLQGLGLGFMVYGFGTRSKPYEPNLLNKSLALCKAGIKKVRAAAASAKHDNQQ